MEILEIKTGFFMRVTRKEAIDLIRSLSTQLSQNNPNAERLESYCNKGKYFTIAVEQKPNQPKRVYREGMVCELFNECNIPYCFGKDCKDFIPPTYTAKS